MFLEIEWAIGKEMFCFVLFLFFWNQLERERTLLPVAGSLTYPILFRFGLIITFNNSRLEKHHRESSNEIAFAPRQHRRGRPDCMTALTTEDVML